MRKLVFISLSLGLLIIIGLPFLTLLAPASLRDFVYRYYILSEISKEVAGDASSDQLTTERLLDFIYSNNCHYRRMVVDDATALNDLLTGNAYCDQVSNALNNLLMFRGIDGALVMYINHSVSIVQLDGKWRFMDPLYGILLRDSQGNLATLEDVVARDSAFSSRGKGNINSEFFIRTYKRMFTPDKHMSTWKPPRFSFHGVKKVILLGIDIYDAVLGRWYFRIYQEAYIATAKHLAHEVFDLTDPGQAGYYKARTYQICGEADKAVKAYTDYLREYPASEYAERAELFRASSLMKLGEWRQARTEIATFMERHPESKLNALVRLYLEWCRYHLEGGPIPEHASDVSYEAFYFR